MKPRTENNKKQAATTYAWFRLLGFGRFSSCCPAIPFIKQMAKVAKTTDVKLEGKIQP